MLFEIGPVFKGSKPGEQTTMIGAIKPGKYSRKNWIEKDRKFDVFDIKNDAIRILNEIGIDSIVELIEKARKTQCRILVKFNYSKELVNLIKSKRYSFNGETKEWSKIITDDQVGDEKLWLQDNIYKGSFSGLLEQVNLIDKYKDR